jgi:hypothetical protein
MQRADIENRVSHHPPADEHTAHLHDAARAVVRRAMYDLDIMVPDGREHSLCMTKLEECLMWANAGIAREGTKPQGVEHA